MPDAGGRRALPPEAIFLLAGAVLTPVAVSWAGADTFRLPKELALYAFAIAAAAALSLRKVFGARLLPRRQPWELRAVLVLAVAGTLWTALSTSWSPSPGLTVRAFTYVAATCAVAVVAAVSLKLAPVSIVLGAVLLPAVFNSLIIILQAADIWNPWVFAAGTGSRLMRIGFLGNPNDAGSYLAAVLVCSATWAACTRRLLPVAISVLIATSLLLTLTLSAVAAAVVSLTVLAGLLLFQRGHSFARSFLIAPGVILVLALAPALAYAPLRGRMISAVNAASAGSWDRALSGRLGAFVSAWEMIKDEPLTGVGAGAFKYRYMQYRVTSTYAYPHLNLSEQVSARYNFGEVHNDHLQILAETGIVGYSFVVGLLTSVAALSRHVRRAATDRQRVASLLALPLVICLAFNMLAAFPLQLASCTYLYAVLAGLSFGWMDTDARMNTDDVA